MRHPLLLSMGLLTLSGCDRLGTIPYSPEQTPQTWLEIQPFLSLKIGVGEVILVQPSSTFFVYLLGIIAIAGGLFFFHVQGSQRSRWWWGIALVLWGLGALFAGTSYQAFSYEIKCAGREVCSWTSWWEVVYLLFSAASVDAMLVAGAYSSSAGKWRKGLIYYAFVNIVLYMLAVMIGAFFLVKFLISFELLLLVAAPNILLLFALNGWSYYRSRKRMDLVLLVAWLWLGFTIGSYFLYYISGLTEELWGQGIWFSENDVLHIGLIIWMIYLAVVVARQILDKPATIQETI